MATDFATVRSLPRGLNMDRNLRDELKKLIAKKAIVREHVKLSRGQDSPYYFDCKRVTLDSEGASLVADAFLDEIARLPKPPAAIGGLTLGADPIVGSVITRAHERGLKLDGFFVRKEPKKHGTKAFVENAPEKGSDVVIVDDVITTGGSALDAIRQIREIGCNVVAIISLVDRKEGGEANLRRECPKYIPIFSLEDFPELDSIEPIVGNSVQAEAGAV